MRHTFHMTAELQEIKSDKDSINTYKEAMSDIIDLLSEIAPSQWQSPTPCPGWTVADIAAHLIDLDTGAITGTMVDHEPQWESLAHVTNAGSKFTERGVDFRRGTAPDALLDQLSETAQALVDHLKNNENEIGLKLPWFKGEMSVEQFLSMRTFDIWVHEQDIRAALNIPGNLGSNPARASLQRMISALPFIWGKKVGAPPGSVLTLHLSGPEIQGSVGVVVNDDGRAELVHSHPDAENTVSMSWPSFSDSFCGRMGVGEMLACAELNGPLAEAFVTQLPSTP